MMKSIALVWCFGNAVQGFMSVTPPIKPRSVTSSKGGHLRQILITRSDHSRGPRAALDNDMSDAVIDMGNINFAEASSLSDIVFKSSDFPATTGISRSRHRWSEECETALNNQINVEFTAFYAYSALFAFFDRDDVALKGFAEFFRLNSLEERTHAEEFIKYQNTRGGRVHLKPLAVPGMSFPSADGKSDALYAMEYALFLEKVVYDKLRLLHDAGTNSNDPALCDLVEQYLAGQHNDMREKAEYVAQIRRVADGHGVWHIDKALQAA